MLLSIEKIMSFGWRPKYKSAEAVRLAARKMIEKKGVN
jgi:hypothetical protein